MHHRSFGGRTFLLVLALAAFAAGTARAGAVDEKQDRRIDDIERSLKRVESDFTELKYDSRRSEAYDRLESRAGELEKQIGELREAQRKSLGARESAARESSAAAATTAEKIEAIGRELQARIDALEAENAALRREIEAGHAELEEQIAGFNALQERRAQEQQALFARQIDEKARELDAKVLAAQRVRFSGLLQFAYQDEESARPNNTFRLRTLRTGLSGDVRKDISWSVLFDLAAVREDATTKATLLDCILSYKPSKEFGVDLGQMTVPFGMEGLDSTGKLDFVDRAALSTVFKWSASRDQGVFVKGSHAFGKTTVAGTAGVINGEGSNRWDGNEWKDEVARVTAKFPGNFQAGLSHYYGKAGAAETENLHSGLDMRYEDDRVMVKGEYAQGRAAGVEKRTWYADAGYRFAKAFQGVVRYDCYDPDTCRTNDARNEVVLGCNWFLEKHNAKVQANYVFRNEEGPKQSANDMVKLNFQISY